MTFAVKTPVFEGPLDLLLTLIEKRKLLINDIALASVADEYLAHIQQLETFPTRDAAHFVLVASTLVLIKSRSLLPEFTLTSEEEADVADLEMRLMLYKRIKEAAKTIESRFGEAVLYPATISAHSREVVFAPHKSISVVNIVGAAQNVIARLPKLEALKKVVVEKIMSLEEMMGHLTDRIKGALKLHFKDFAAGAAKDVKTEREVRINTIVGFLAMLELVKQGALMVKQNKLFSDIEMETGSVSVPQY